MRIAWRYEYSKLRERLFRALAWLLPEQLVMWCFIRVLAHATTGQYGNTNPTELPAMAALERWPVEK